MNKQLQRINDYIDSLESQDNIIDMDNSIVLSGGEGIVPFATSNDTCTNIDGTCVKSTNNTQCINAKGTCIDTKNKKVCNNGGGTIVANGGCSVNPVNP